MWLFRNIQEIMVKIYLLYWKYDIFLLFDPISNITSNFGTQLILTALYNIANYTFQSK